MKGLNKSTTLVTYKLLTQKDIRAMFNSLAVVVTFPAYLESDKYHPNLITHIFFLYKRILINIF